MTEISQESIARLGNSLQRRMPLSFRSARHGLMNRPKLVHVLAFELMTRTSRPLLGLLFSLGLLLIKSLAMPPWCGLPEGHSRWAAACPVAIEMSSLPTKFGSMASGLRNMTSLMRSSGNLLRRLVINHGRATDRLGRTQKKGFSRNSQASRRDASAGVARLHALERSSRLAQYERLVALGDRGQLAASRGTWEQSRGPREPSGGPGLLG